MWREVRHTGRQTGDEFSYQDTSRIHSEYELIEHAKSRNVHPSPRCMFRQTWNVTGTVWKVDFKHRPGEARLHEPSHPCNGFQAIHPSVQSMPTSSCIPKRHAGNTQMYAVTPCHIVGKVCQFHNVQVSTSFTRMHRFSTAVSAL